MELNEWKNLAKGLKAVYTRDTFLPDAESVKMWFMLLQDIPYEQINVALQKWMTTQKFPPTPAEIREVAAELIHGRIEDWSEEWKIVLSAIRGYSPGLQRKMDFNDITKEVVKRLGGVEFMSQARSYTDLDVLRASFRDIYNYLYKKAVDKRQMPLSLQEEVTQMIGNEAPKELPKAPLSGIGIDLAEEARTAITEEQIQNFVERFGFNPLEGREE